MAGNIVHAACSVHTPLPQMQKMRGEGIFTAFQITKGLWEFPLLEPQIKEGCSTVHFTEVEVDTFYQTKMCKDELDWNVIRYSRCYLHRGSCDREQMPKAGVAIRGTGCRLSGLNVNSLPQRECLSSGSPDGMLLGKLGEPSRHGVQLAEVGQQRLASGVPGWLCFWLELFLIHRDMSKPPHAPAAIACDQSPSYHHECHCTFLTLTLQAPRKSLSLNISLSHILSQQ